MKRVVIVVVFGWLVACASGGGITDDVPAADGGTAKTDGGTTETGAGCTTFCNNVCTDPRTDGQNCGTCGAVCPMGETCEQGSCQCSSGQTRCGSLCVDTKNDAMNCGACGMSCGGQPNGGGGLGCANGTCSCPQSKTACNDACVDTQTDIDNCGMCNNGCIQGTETCMEGLCCMTGQTVCNVIPGDAGLLRMCTDVLSDPNNCGMCGTVCPTNTYCGNGTCVAKGEYSQAFTQNQPSAGACNAWNTFRTNLNGPYTKIVLKGTNDPLGVECNGTDADTLCQALKNGADVSNIDCGGRKWRINADCPGGIPDMALAALADGQGSDACSCVVGAYIARPCTGGNWGGINSSTCGAASQTITVICQ